MIIGILKALIGRQVRIALPRVLDAVVEEVVYEQEGPIKGSCLACGSGEHYAREKGLYVCCKCGRKTVNTLARHIFTHGTCPDCLSPLYEGPCGGMSMNVKCSSDRCGSRFNITPSLDIAERLS